MKREAIEVRRRERAVIAPQFVTLEEIDAVKRAFIERTLSFSPEEAGAIFGKSARWAIGKVKDGVFIAIDEGARKGEDGILQLSRYGRITAESVAAYRKSIMIAPGYWCE